MQTRVSANKTQPGRETPPSGGRNNNYDTGGKGACDPKILGKYFSGRDLNIAICVCDHESGGNLLTVNDKGLRPATEDINNADYSIGPMQYNLWTCGRCDAAWETCLIPGKQPPLNVGAKIKNFEALQACAANVGVKIERVPGIPLTQKGGTRATAIDFDSYTRNTIVPLRNGAGGWGNWSTYKYCR